MDPIQIMWENKVKTRWMYFLVLLLLAAPIDFAFAQGKKGGGPAASAAATPAAAPAPSSSAAIEAQMLAFGALDKIAVGIASQVCPLLPTPAVSKGPTDPGVPASTVVIYDQPSFVSLQAYEAFIANATAIVSLYETLLGDTDKNTLGTKLKDLARQAHPDRPVPHAIGLSGTIDPFSDATSLLSAIAIASNTETPGAIVIPDSAMAVAVTRQLAATPCDIKHAKVIYPPLFGNSSTTDFASADIQSDLQTLQDVRDFVVHAVNAENVTWMKDHPSSPNGNPILTSALTDINTLYDSFMNSLLQVNSTTGIVGSATVIQGYQLANVLAGPVEKNGSYKHPAFILLASILSAGGTEHVHKNIWTALWSGDKITYSGGVIVNVALWHSDDKAPLYTDLLRYRAPFSKVDNPANMTGVTIGDNLPKPPPIRNRKEIGQGLPHGPKEAYQEEAQPEPKGRAAFLRPS